MLNVSAYVQFLEPELSLRENVFHGAGHDICQTRRTAGGQVQHVGRQNLRYSTHSRADNLQSEIRTKKPLDIWLKIEFIGTIIFLDGSSLLNWR